ncbi:MAG: hypothetical protein HQK84_06395 [Nitrospinae bacterium]|nr:hypothetical protein [Nitrospinota bacterium]
MKNSLSTAIILLFLCIYSFSLVDKRFLIYERDMFFSLQNGEIAIANPVNSVEGIYYQNNEFNLYFNLPDEKYFQAAIRFKQKLFLPIHVYINGMKVNNLSTSRIKEELYETVFTLSKEDLGTKHLNKLQFFGTSLKPENLLFVTVQNFRGGNKSFPEIYILFEDNDTRLLDRLNYGEFSTVFIISLLISFFFYSFTRLAFSLTSQEAQEIIMNSFIPSFVLLSIFVFSNFVIPYRIYLPETTFNLVAFFLTYIVLLINSFFQYRENVVAFIRKKTGLPVLILFSIVTYLFLFYL